MPLPPPPLTLQVIATFVASADRDPDVVEYQKQMDLLNRFMAKEQLAYPFRRELREYFMNTKHLRATRRDHKLLSDMSKRLQSRVLWQLNGKWLKKVPFLRKAAIAHEAFLVQLSLNLAPQVFAPGEFCPLGFLYFLHRGMAAYEGGFRSVGDYWGDDVILGNEALRSKNFAKAITFLDVFTVKYQVIDWIAASYPDVTMAIRWSAIRLALRRYLALEEKLRQVNTAAQAEGKSVSAADPSSESKDLVGMLAMQDVDAVQQAALDSQTRASYHASPRDASHLSGPGSSACAGAHSTIHAANCASSCGAITESGADAPGAVTADAKWVGSLLGEVGGLRENVRQLSSQGQRQGSAVVSLHEEVSRIRESIEALTDALAMGGLLGKGRSASVAWPAASDSIATGGLLGKGRSATVTRPAATSRAAVTRPAATSRAAVESSGSGGGGGGGGGGGAGGGGKSIFGMLRGGHTRQARDCCAVTTAVVSSDSREESGEEPAASAAPQRPPLDSQGSFAGGSGNSLAVCSGKV